MNLHALGLWYLLASRGGPTDFAVTSLEQAISVAPREGEIWNDLAVALYLRACERESLGDLARSLAASDHALEIAPGMPAALFNRALALTALFLHGEAAPAWRQFLTSADSPEWAEEASARLAQVVLSARPRGFFLARESLSRWIEFPQQAAEIVASDPVGALRFAEIELLSDASSQRAALPSLKLAELVGEALWSKAGDRLLTREVEAWSRSARSGVSPGSQLAAGYAAFREASKLYETLDIEHASQQFEQAEKVLSASESPLRYWASYWLAACQYWTGDLEGAGSRLDSLEGEVGEKEYPLLQGYTALLSGLIEASRSHFDRAVEQYRQALSTFEKSGAHEQAGFSRVLLAEVFELLNEPREAQSQLYRALAGVESWKNQRWQQGLFDQIAAEVRALGEPEAALYFHKAAAEAAKRSGQAPTISEEYASRALALVRLGRKDAAVADVAEARRWLEKITDAAVRRQTEDSVLVAEARVGGEQRPTSAIEALTQAIGDRQRRGVVARLPALEVERGRLLTNLGRLEEARGALLGAVVDIEIGSASVGAERRRSAYFDTVREAFDEIIRFELDVRKDPLSALVFTDRARVHEFLTARINYEYHPSIAGLSALRARLRPADGVLIYRVLEERLLLWVVKREEVVFREQPLAARELSAQIDTWTRVLRETSSSTLPFGSVLTLGRAHLYEELIAPVATSLSGVERLWIVPDGPLFRLPFGALAESGARRLLCERFRLAKALTAGLGDKPRRLAPQAGVESLLAVGDPDFSLARFPSLGRLPWAWDEAKTATRGYPHAKALLGAEATRARFLKELDRWDVVHFAGHALPNEQEPELSTLVLAPGPDDDEPGVLYAKDIERLTLSHTRLVILAACGTAAGQGPGSGGYYGLVRPFLAAGAPIVIGSLWRVDDASTAGIFSVFHRLLGKGSIDVLEVLRRSQEIELDQGKSDFRAVYTGAAFEAYVSRPEPD